MITDNSSWIQSFSYDASTGDLDVQTRSGATYTYGDVPQGVADEMSAADSKGTFHNENLRDSYVCVRN